MNPVLIFTHFLNGLLMVALPVAVGILLARKFQLGWRLWWIGAVTFVLSQIGHIPFNVAVGLLFERGILPTPAPSIGLLFSAVFAGLSAGVWEESFRYGAFRWWAKEARSWSKALMLGSGWGGAEAIILGILVLINYAVMVAAQVGDISSLIPEGQAALLDQQIAVYWSLPWYDTLLGALERAFALTVQICLSVMVVQVFIRKNILWLFIAIGWHALVDALAVYLVSTTSAYVTEAVIGITAIISLVVIYALRQPEYAREEPQIISQPTPSDMTNIIVDDPSLEKLDESKYD
jgi:uncharacterized membrane protein YhfC